MRGRQHPYDEYRRTPGGRAPRYDQQPRQRGYDALRGRYGTPMPGAAGYPSARWGWSPVGWMGWAPGTEFWPYADVPGYGFGGEYPTPRRPPRDSPAYGRRGDRQLQRWARRYGYDLGYRIPPRPRR